MTVQRIEPGKRMSEAVIHNGVVYLAGQVGEGDTVAAQTRDALNEIERLLGLAGSSKSHILQATIWLADIADFQEMNSVWDDWVAEGCAPARATGESRLADSRYRVEILIIAAVA